jgi:hypothetical protein
MLRPTWRERWLIALPLALAILLVATNLAAAAGQRFEASGTVVATGMTQSNVRSADGVTFFDYTEQDILLGTFIGTSVLETSCVVRSSGQGVCHGVETFTGTVAGESGTAQFRDVVHLDATPGAFHGTFTAVGGTGGLANLRGHGTFQGSSGASTYTGQLIFAP